MSRGGDATIIDADADVVGNYGLYGYRDPKNPGYSQKLEWLKQRFEEGMRIKVLHSERDGTVGSMEYLPGEYAWRGVRASGYMFIHSDQCPYVIKTMNEIPAVAREELGIEPTIVDLPTCQMAQESPNPYGVFSIIWNGELVADHPISATRFKSIMNKALK